MLETTPTPESSNLVSFSYDDASQLLTVEFKHGGTYDYFEVPAQVHDEMKAAASRGTFLATRIKGTYRYAKR